NAACISLAIATNPSGGTLCGVTTARAINGVATFSNLSIDKAGAGYTLSPSSTGLTGATSSRCSISVGPATLLAVPPQPPPAMAGASLTVTVPAQDAFGNTATGYRGTTHFTSTDAQALLPGTYRFTPGDNRVHTFNSGVTLRTAGSQTVTATYTVTSSITGT